MAMLAQPGRGSLSTQRYHLCIRLNWRAAAHQVPVAVGTVDPPDGGPNLVLAYAAGRIRRPLPGIRSIPRIRDDLLQRMRCVGEHIVAAVRTAVLDLSNFLSNGYEGVAKAVELLLGFTLCWLDHQRPRNRERDRWRVKAVIDDPLGNVLHVYTCGILEGPGIYD